MLLQVAQVLKRIIKTIGLWSYVKTLARGYHIAIGFLLFSPVLLLAWFPFVSEFQTRIIFNPAFSRGLQTSWILGRHKRDPAVRKEM
jgi:callose synthase